MGTKHGPALWPLPSPPATDHALAAACLLQVTVASLGPPPELPGLQVDVSPVRLFGQQFKLHTFTFKRYGLNDAFDQSVTLLLKKVGE